MTAGAVPDLLELEVRSIAAGGDGVGRSNGLVVFVPRTAPGDVAEVRVESVKRFARGHLEKLLLPSSRRAEPPCVHYTRDSCGGCQIQHLQYGAQLDAKQGIVSDALHRIARQQTDVPHPRPSPREWRYRNKLTLTMRRTRESWTMGLHPYFDPVGVFQLEDCPITDERVVAAWQEIRNASSLLPESGELRGTVRLADENLIILIRGGTAWPAAAAFFDAVPAAASLSWIPDHGESRLLYERRATAAATSFGQVNAMVAAELRAHLLNRVSAHAPESVVDAYSGTGDTAAALASRGVRVTAIELDREAAAVCATRLQAGSRSLVGRVENLLIAALPADLVIVNPPRAGLHARVTAALEQQRQRPRAILYVSCDPATLGRDIARLPHYRIASVQPFDMFPQTAHVETICELVPVAG
jgi:23S rRNA (uracil1939-C5)-methyltransferase